MTLRAGSSVVAFAFVVAAVVLLLGDAVIRGSWAVGARGAGPGALVVWGAWMLLVRPSIRVLPDRAVITNVGRITEVPWARVVDIRRKLQLVFELDDDRRLEAWGSPFASRRRTDDDPSLIALRGAWMSAQDASSGAVVRRPDSVALLIGAAAVLFLVITLVVFR
ncbi:MAG TPA: hypothetical protein VGO65_12495 [Pseudolysinimonas sp.]|nr:hypothetical protein [Pseudolysinimonas sp.]